MPAEASVLSVPFPADAVQGSGRGVRLSPLPAPVPGRAPLARLVTPVLARRAPGHCCPEHSAGGRPPQQPCFPGTDAFCYDICSALNLLGAASPHEAQAASSNPSQNYKIWALWPVAAQQLPPTLGVSFHVLAVISCPDFRPFPILV